MSFNLTLGQYVHRESLLHRLDPRTKLVAISVLLISIFRAQSPLVFSILSLLVGVGLLVSQVSWREYYRSIRALWLVLILSFVITNWGENSVWPGLYAVWKLILAIIATSIITYCTQPMALTDGLEALASPLARLGVPVHELALIISIAVRFIPLLLEEGTKVYEAQKLRGAKFQALNPLVRAKAYIALLVPLFLGSIRRADELAVAMESRFYRGAKERTRLRELKLTYVDKVVFSFVVIVVLVWLGKQILSWIG